MFTKEEKRKYLNIALILLIILGSLNSLFITIHNIAIESDTADTVTLWNGLHEYGLDFLKDYKYTIDNWAFSLIPIHFLAFYLFGPSPNIVILGGWVTYLLILLFLYICASKSGLNYHQRLIALCFLSLANVGTLWYCGYLTYSVSHNISILFFLVSYCLIIKHKTTSSILIYISINILAAISDPWLSFAFVLPMFVAGLTTFYFKKDIFFIKISAASLFIFLTNIISVKTNVFGLFPYIVGAEPFRFSAQILSNKIHFITRTFGFFFQFLPEKIVPKESQDGMVLGFWIVLFSCSIINFLSKIKEKTSNEISTFSLFILSILSLLAAQILFADVTADFSGRYIITIFLLSPFIFIYGFKNNLSKFLKTCFIMFILLYLYTTASTSHHFWKNGRYNTTRPDEVTEILKSENLSFGYGLYWDAEAPAVTWINNGKLTVRSVLFDNNSKRLTRQVGWQTNALWYKNEDVKNQPKRQFLILKNTGYGDPCGDNKFVGCGKELSNQFGTPEKVVTKGDYTVFIWNKPLLPYFTQ